MKYDYKQGLVPVIQAGALQPVGTAILVRAILAADSSTLHTPTLSAGDAECHEIVALGGGVGRFFAEKGESTQVQVGMHAYIRSTAADKMSSDNSVRYFLLDAADLKAVWWPIEAPKQE